MSELATLVTSTLERVRRERGRTWEQLAVDFGVDSATLWRWRQGDVGPSARILIPLVAEQCRAEIALHERNIPS
jgi:transcriptional regulator with XRE-family HTH domain